MKKAGVVVGIGFALLVVGGGIAARLAAGALVESEEFRSTFNQVLERAMKSVVPHAMTSVKQVSLSGLATLDVRGVEIRSDKQIDAVLKVPRVKIKPTLMSLIGSGPLRISADAELESKGRLDFEAKIPKALLEDQGGSKAGQLEVTGNVLRLGAVEVTSLLFADGPSNPNFRLTRGFLSGSFLLKKPFGPNVPGGRKAGEINAKLESAEWSLAVGSVKKIQPPPLDLHVEIKDFALELRAPVVMVADKAGRATIAGALKLPERADKTLAWNLDVKTEGLLLQGSLAKLFKCKVPPTSPHFTVVGPIAQTHCAAAP